MADDENNNPEQPQTGPEETRAEIKQQPDPQQPPVPPQNNREEERVIRSSRHFIYAGAILGVISFIFGGILFGIIGIICAYWAYRKIKMFTAGQALVSAGCARMRRNAIIAIIVCAAAILFCAVYLIALYPALYEAMSSGDLSSVLSGTETATNTTWG